MNISRGRSTPGVHKDKAKQLSCRNIAKRNLYDDIPTGNHVMSVYLELVLALLCSMLCALQGPQGFTLVTCQLPQLGSSLLLQPIYTALKLLLSRFCPAAKQGRQSQQKTSTPSGELRCHSILASIGIVMKCALIDSLWCWLLLTSYQDSDYADQTRAPFDADMDLHARQSKQKLQQHQC